MSIVVSFFLFWLSFRLFPLFRWFVYDWRILMTFSSSFCWNLSQLSTRIVSTCGFCSVSVSFLVSILFSGLSLFYVVSLSFKRQTFSFTASSTSLPDSLLLLFNLPLNVNHSKKRSVIFYSDGSNRKFSFTQSPVEHKMILFLLSIFAELFLGLYSKTQYQLRDFA